MKEPLFSTWSSENVLHAAILSLKSSFDWIMNYYVNLFFLTDLNFPHCNPEYGIIPASLTANTLDIINVWNLCPFAKVDHVSLFFIQDTYDTIIDYIIHAIDLEYFVCIKMKPLFRHPQLENDHSLREFYFYGYNRENRVFYVADHCEAQKFTTYVIPFDETADALPVHFGMEKTPVENKDNQITVFKLREYDYFFDVHKLVYQLEDYLRGEYRLNALSSTGKSITSAYLFGVDYYSALEKHIFNVYSKKIRGDHRVFTILVDHKTAMYLRINYLMDHGYIKKGPELPLLAEQLLKSAKMLLNLFLKLMIFPNVENYKKLSNKLMAMKEIDSSFTKELIVALKTELNNKNEISPYSIDNFDIIRYT